MMQRKHNSVLCDIKEMGNNPKVIQSCHGPDTGKMQLKYDSSLTHKIS